MKEQVIKHGTPKVTQGKLKGETCRTDYFYFLCPRCDGKQMLRILKYETRLDEPENDYNQFYKKKASSRFILGFRLRCEKCGLEDYTKISNIGFQEGDIKNA